MVSNPVQNINYFLKKRPPLVVFLLCLVALTVSTFYFAFEIESEARTLDSDKKHDWLQLLKHFNKLKPCLVPASAAKNEPKLKENFSVFTHLEIENFKLLQKFSEVRGSLTLEEWNPTACLSDQILPKTVEIYFKIPKESSKNQTINVCAEIQGPPEILPKFSKPNCALEKTESKNKAQGFLETYLAKDFNLDFCQRGDTAKVNFLIETNEIDNYINDDIRIRIYRHLIWFSYILVFFIFCIILYAIFHKDEEMRKDLGLRLL